MSDFTHLFADNPQESYYWVHAIYYPGNGENTDFYVTLKSGVFTVFAEDDSDAEPLIQGSATEILEWVESL